MTQPTPEQIVAGRQIAYRIRAELVCCNIYQRVQESEMPLERMGDSHAICYWGEASARIAEAPEQWQNDPTEWDWSQPDAVQRRARRTNEDSQGAAR